MIPAEAEELLDLLDEDEELIEGEAPPAPARSWAIDFDRGRITEPCDGAESLQDWIHTALKVVRFEHEIYSEDFGSELDSLIGMPIDWCEAEAKRLITEALEIDDRIDSVDSFEFQNSGSILSVKFTVSTVSEEIEMEVDLDV